MSEDAGSIDTRVRTLGEVVRITADETGRGACDVIFPGVHDGLVVQVSRRALRGAGVHVVVGANFTAEVDVAATEADQLGPEAFDSLLAEDLELNG